MGNCMRSSSSMVDNTQSSHNAACECFSPCFTGDFCRFYIFGCLLLFLGGETGFESDLGSSTWIWSCWSWSRVETDSELQRKDWPGDSANWISRWLRKFELCPGSIDGSKDSKVTSKTNSSSAPSTLKTDSTSSTLTLPSYKDKRETLPTPRTEGEILSSPNLKAFTFNDVRDATKNFRPESLLGGGFGFVYKGWIDEQTLAPSKPGSGMVVAVKKLKPEGFQGHKEWLTEVGYLGQLHHPNLLKLIGYCAEGKNRLLVYEFVPKGSLEIHLFRRSSQPLSWAIRLKVAIGAARGLSFLHDAEYQVICRDFKASNILLDLEYNAKLADFGLAKAGPTGDRTHVFTQVVGTHGYAAPEYVATGRLSAKANVYSFGVVLLELLTGRRAAEKTKAGVNQNLVDWVKPYLGNKHKLYCIMDTNLEGQYPNKAAYAVANLASKCICNESKLRPRMSEILPELEQLQDTKNDALPHLIDNEGAPHAVAKSPMRTLPSPGSLAGASPLPSCGPTMLAR